MDCKGRTNTQGQLVWKGAQLQIARQRPVLWAEGWQSSAMETQTKGLFGEAF